MPTRVVKLVLLSLQVAPKELVMLARFIKQTNDEQMRQLDRQKGTNRPGLRPARRRAR